MHVIPVLLRRICEIGNSQRTPNPCGFDTLPSLKRVYKSKADIAWLIYDLELIKDKKEPGKYSLKKVDEVFTEFEPALVSITTPSPGKVEDFIRLLQEKLDEHLETPPVTKTIEKPF